MEKVIYTIGHSTHPIGYFLQLIKSHGITCLVDVRSVAASRFNPQYNKKALQKSLDEINILYMHFDQEFGARQMNPESLDINGQVDFEKVRWSEKFLSGIERLQQGVRKGYTITLMCAEAEPLDCHRFGMITPALKEAGFEVNHILKDNTLLSTEGLENKLLEKFNRKIPLTDLYSTREERLKKAHRLLNDRIGFNTASTS